MNNISIDCDDLILRGYVLDDIESIYSITQEPEVKEYLPDWDVPKKQRMNWLENYEIPENQQFQEAISSGGRIGDLRLRLAVISKTSGDLIGWCCSGIKEEIDPPNREIMFAIASRYQNKGYCTQATLGVINYLFQNSDVEALNAIARIDNIPSNRVIKKAGFDQVGLIEIEEEKFNRFMLSKDKWK
ncbi:N-acetyltransferase [Xylanibacillus composti]|uniref:N-acetyltransferase n=1 Tax=Xylanibacillus composti TaxID=1572762 RepID=A0A8J4H7V6_9BACL|nr:GNAT family N-acetyltransferase [Xylanibacillus composti]MDT9727139.1 N-acetyltransferase [Xylanibacillus composti]GIQ71401.1 N-acetyltransferase [Xylanibacillus composti]